MARPSPSFNSTPEQSTQAEVLALLNHNTRTEAVRSLAPRDYRGGPSRVKLWVGPEAIGAELLKNLNSEADRRIDKNQRDLSEATLNRHKQTAHQKNRDRVDVFVNDLRSKGTIFLRVDIDGGEGLLAHQGSVRGRKEIELLRKTGVISNIRDAKFYGAACAGSINTFVALPRDKVKSLARLEEHARSFDQGARLELGLRHLQQSPVIEPVSGDVTNPRIDRAFEQAAKGIENDAEREDLRQQFDQAVTILQQQKSRSATPHYGNRNGFGSRGPFA